MYNIFWWRDMRYGYNFGDEFAPWLINKINGITYDTPCSLNSDSILFSVGSILWACNDRSTIWGSGIIDLKQPLRKLPKKVCTVRGLFSRQKLLTHDVQCPEIYGDPAVLAPMYFNPKVEQKYELGIIPHIVEYQDIKKKYSNIDNIKIINLQTRNIESVIKDILSCKTTLCSALHGLIISVMYDIPTRWIKLSNKLYGDGIKYYDFFSSLDHKVFENFNLNTFNTKQEKYNPLIIKDKDLRHLINQTYLYSKENINISKIIESCPLL